VELKKDLSELNVNISKVARKALQKEVDFLKEKKIKNISRAMNGFDIYYSNEASE